MTSADLATPGPLARRLAAGATACTMLVFAAFWMLTWLIGTNGYGSARGGTILFAQAAAALLAVPVAATLAHDWTRRLQGRGWTGLPAAVAGSGAAVVLALVALVVVAVGTVVVVGDRP
ncbi:hypothetical protein [Lysobacter humi (ex Lee et al. 2017)]